MEKAACVRKEAVAAPEEAPPTLMAPEKEPEKCYKKTVGEEATFLESAKDYFNQFKAMPAQKHWICLKNYFSQKCSSVFGKQKVEPVVKDETQEGAKPAAVESR
ncbi:uncharacterized protein LOC120649925 [Panicum virgatum]|uniref:Uncharacterized protein n=1 Tax=Panicum virgatum TaxID=38727 RepID=A0A8T0NGT3_PANVG|nr:uncharacterized protein LOC120649925 [Panicum virgatum]KAG2546246.1 hypothetical protein PVAP13_9KG043701 [Panicum virgatum]